MLTHYWKTLVSTVSVCVLFGVSSPARAQYGFDGAPGYPYAGQQGYGGFSTPFGGFGWSGYGSNPQGLSGFDSVGFGFGGVSGNFNGNGKFGASSEPNSLPCGPGCSAGEPQAQISFQPTLGMVTAVPGWNGTSQRSRRRTTPRSTALISRPFDGAGKTASPHTLPKKPNITPDR